MRRGGGFGEVYGASRAGEWEFASYRADGTTLIEPANAVQCAACHLKAGAEKDFVLPAPRLRRGSFSRGRLFRLFLAGGAGTTPDPPVRR